MLLFHSFDAMVRLPSRWTISSWAAISSSSKPPDRVLRQDMLRLELG